jgi:hypothetical protein
MEADERAGDPHEGAGEIAVGGDGEPGQLAAGVAAEPAAGDDGRPGII